MLSLRVSRRFISFWPKSQKGVDKKADLAQLEANKEDEKAVAFPEIAVETRVFQKRVGIEDRKRYKPSDDVVPCIEAVTKQIYGKKENWQDIELTNRVHKFNLVTSVMERLNHDVPNISLHDMKTVQDVITYFQTEVKDPSVIDDLSQKDLPKNLHMNTDYVRFNRETDPIYSGVTAFPGSETVVSSLKYRRKYKGTDGGDVVNYPAKVIGKN